MMINKKNLYLLLFVQILSFDFVKSEEINEGFIHAYKFTANATISISEIVSNDIKDEKCLNMNGEFSIQSDGEKHFLFLNYFNATAESVETQIISSGDQVHPAQFTLDNGKIVKFSMHKNESSLAGNILKSILSLLQTSFSSQINNVEEDISGRCPTTYEVTGNIVKKLKILDRCKLQGRENIFSFGLPYSTDSENDYKDIPFVNSTSYCTQEIENQTVVKVKCEENYSISYFASNANVLTQIVTSVELIDRKSRNNSLSEDEKTDFVESSLMYTENNQNIFDSLSRKFRQISSKLLSGYCRYYFDDNLLYFFSDVKELILGLNSTKFLSQLQTLFEGKTHDKLLRKTYRNLVLGSPNVVLVDHVLELIKTVSASEMDEILRALFSNIKWTAKLKNIQRDFLASLEKLSKLDLDNDLTTRLNFAISQVLSNVVRQNNLTEAVIASRDSLISKIIENEWASSEAELVEIYSDIDAITKKLVTSCSDCVLQSLPILQSLHSASKLKTHSCYYWSDIVRNTLRKRNVNSDLLIQAYLASFNCGDPDDILEIGGLFQKPSTNSDVLNFISSHIENIISSENPIFASQKITAEKLLQNVLIYKQNKPNGRRLSKNYMWTYFDKESNQGINLEVNVIFSNRSYLPSVIEANLTVQIKGRSFNLLEVGIITNGLESLIEKYLMKKSTMIDGRDGIRAHLRVLGVQVYTEEFSIVDIENLIIMALEQFPSLKLDLQKLRRKLASANKNIRIFKSLTAFKESLVVPTMAGMPIHLEIQLNSLFYLDLDWERSKYWRQKESLCEGNVNHRFETKLLGTVKVGPENKKIGLLTEMKLKSFSALSIDFIKAELSEGPKIYLDLMKVPMTLFEFSRDILWLDNNQHPCRGIRLKNASTQSPSKDCKMMLPPPHAVFTCYHFINSFEQTKVMLSVECPSHGSKTSLEDTILSYLTNLYDDKRGNETKFLGIRLYYHRHSRYSAILKFVTAPHYEGKLDIVTPWIRSSFKAVGNFNDKYRGIVFTYLENEKPVYTGSVYQQMITKNIDELHPEKLGFLGIPILRGTEYELVIQFTNGTDTNKLFTITIDDKEFTLKYIYNNHKFEGRLFDKFDLVKGNDDKTIHEELKELVGIDLQSPLLGHMKFNNSYNRKIVEIRNETSKTIETSFSYGRLNGEKLIDSKIKYEFLRLPDFDNIRLSGSCGKCQNCTFSISYRKNITSCDDCEPKSREIAIRANSRFNQLPLLDTDVVLDLMFTTPSRFGPEDEIHSTIIFIHFYPLNYPSLEAKLSGRGTHSGLALNSRHFPIVREIYTITFPRIKSKILMRLIANPDGYWQVLYESKTAARYALSFTYEPKLNKWNGELSTPDVFFLAQKNVSIKLQDSSFLSFQTVYKFSAMKQPEKIKLVSIVLGVGAERTNLQIESGSKKYLVVGSLDGRNLNSSLILQDVLQSELSVYLKPNNSSYKMDVHGSTKWLPSNLMLTGKFSYYYDNELTLDKDFLWKNIGAEDNEFIGKITGSTVFDSRNFAFRSNLNYLEKGEENTKVIVNGSITTNQDSWKSQFNADATKKVKLFYLKCNLESRDILDFHWQLNSRVFNRSIIKLEAKNSLSGRLNRTSYSSTMSLEVVHKQNESLLNIPNDIDLHIKETFLFHGLSGQWFPQMRLKGNASVSSNSGLLPVPDYKLRYSFDTFPSQESSDRQSKTGDNVELFKFETKADFEENFKNKKAANFKITKYKIRRIKYLSYCNIHDQCSREIFDKPPKSAFEFDYFLEDAGKGNNSTQIINGTSKFVYLYADVDELSVEASHEHEIIASFLSDAPWSSKGIMAYSTDDSRIKLNIGQSGIMEVYSSFEDSNLIFNCSMNGNVKLDLQLDTTMDVDNFCVQLNAKTPFVQANIFNINITHRLADTKFGKSTVSQYKTLVHGNLNERDFHSSLKFLPKLPEEWNDPFILNVVFEGFTKINGTEESSVAFSVVEMGGADGELIPSRIYNFQSFADMNNKHYFDTQGTCSLYSLDCQMSFNYPPREIELGFSLERQTEKPGFKLLIFKPILNQQVLLLSFEYEKSIQDGFWKLSNIVTLNGLSIPSISTNMNATGRQMSDDWMETAVDLNFSGDIVIAIKQLLNNGTTISKRGRMQISGNFTDSKAEMSAIICDQQRKCINYLF